MATLRHKGPGADGVVKEYNVATKGFHPYQPPYHQDDEQDYDEKNPAVFLLFQSDMDK